LVVGLVGRHETYVRAFGGLAEGCGKEKGDILILKRIMSMLTVLEGVGVNYN